MRASQYASDNIGPWQETAHCGQPNMARVHITWTLKSRGYCRSNARKPPHRYNRQEEPPISRRRRPSSFFLLPFSPLPRASPRFHSASIPGFRCEAHPRGNPLHCARGNGSGRLDCGNLRTSRPYGVNDARCPRSKGESRLRGFQLAAIHWFPAEIFHEIFTYLCTIAEYASRAGHYFNSAPG